MGYAVLQATITGDTASFAVVSEHGSNKNAAITKFHQLAAALWNDAGAVNAVIKIVDEHLDTVDGKVEFVNHPAKES